MMLKAAILSAGLCVLGGCASTADIDLSKLEQGCAQTCSTNYSQCLAQFTIFPVQAQRQCVDALRLCTQTCPRRPQ